MVNCMVKSCTNAGSLPGVSYHQIPKYDRNCWLAALQLSPTKYSGNRNTVCSRHFKKDGKIIVLKRGAVPSLFLNFQEPEETVASDSNKFIDDEKTLSSSSENTSEANTSQKSGVLLKRKRTTYSPGTSSDSIGLKGSPKRNRKIVRSIHTYSLSPRKDKQKQLQLVQNMKRKLKTSSQRSRRLKKRVEDLKSIVKDLKRKLIVSQDSLHHLEQTFAGVPQAIMRRMILALRSKNKKRITQKYPDEIKSFALTLQFLSPRAYEYVRSIFDLCLPAQSVIRSWISNVECNPGYV